CAARRRRRCSSCHSRIASSSAARARRCRPCWSWWPSGCGPADGWWRTSPGWRHWRSGSSSSPPAARRRYPARTARPGVRHLYGPPGGYDVSDGTLYGIGVGPGDPELITLKGLRLLQRVPLVFLPATAPGRSMAGAIARPHLAPERQRIVELVCPPLRERAALLARWRELAREIAGALGDGRDAAFVTEGGPSLYSTWQYLAEALRAE